MQVPLADTAGVLVAQREVRQDHGDGERLVVGVGPTIECPARCVDECRGSPAAHGAG
jgi:hypothetical protein